MSRVLIKGNEAIVYGALAAGLRCYFGYPITPQNEIPEMLSDLLPQHGGEFVAAESEVAAANMLLGAGACGVRAMVSSSGPGLSLMQEALSYMAGSEIPGVLVNMSRGGPGLGDIGPSQGDYYQATRGGGHGDYRTLVLAPSTGQECCDMAFEAFDLAFKYRNPVLILGDAMVGQIKEAVNLPAIAGQSPLFQAADQSQGWRLEGRGQRQSRLLKSVWLNNNELQLRVRHLLDKYQSMSQEARAESLDCADASLVLVAFGSMGRLARSLVSRLRREGHAVGLYRPQTLYPFPAAGLAQFAAQGKRLLVVEQNGGQMLEDVRLSVDNPALVSGYSIMPGAYPAVDDFEPAVRKLMAEMEI